MLAILNYASAAYSHRCKWETVQVHFSCRDTAWSVPTTYDERQGMVRTRESDAVTLPYIPSLWFTMVQYLLITKILHMQWLLFATAHGDEYLHVYEKTLKYQYHCKRAAFPTEDKRVTNEPSPFTFTFIHSIFINQSHANCTFDSNQGLISETMK